MSNSAAAVNFAWDFQVNAGIALLVECFDSLDHIRMEGATEDIEISLLDGQYVYAQAKSVVKIDDYSHVRRNCEKALRTLNHAAKQGNHKELILVTNSPNPLNRPQSQQQFYGAPKVQYADLTAENRNVVDLLLAKIGVKNFDKAAFAIKILPFPNALSQRYEEIERILQKTVGRLDYRIAGKITTIMEAWQKDLFRNGSVVDTAITVTKRQLQWPIVVTQLDNISITESADALEFDIDPIEIEEITVKYHDMICNQAENFEFLTRVIAEYYAFGPDVLHRDRKKSFLAKQWEQFKDPFSIEGCAEYLQEILTKIVMNKIIDTRLCIEKIMHGRF